MDNKSALNTLNKVMGFADDAIKPYKAALKSEVLLYIQLGAVAQWVSAQDESADPARIMEISRQAVANIHAKYNRREF